MRIMQKRYSEVLEECIHRCVDSGEPIEVVLSEHPKWKEQLREDLEAAVRLGEVRKSLQPRREFIPSARNTILKQIEQEPKFNNFWDRLFNPEKQLAARYFTALLVIIIFSIASGGLIIASDRPLPGDGLYPVRRISEIINLVLTIDSVKEAKLQQRLAQDYLVACADLVSQGRSEDALVALRKYEIHISGTGRQLLEISQSGNGNLYQLKSNFSSFYLQDLETLQVILPDEY